MHCLRAALEYKTKHKVPQAYSRDEESLRSLTALEMTCFWFAQFRSNRVQCMTCAA